MKNLTANNKANEREIEMMVAKAMCAYANWQSTEDDAISLVTIYGDAMVDRSITAHKSEYEATVRCIAMFVSESVPAICQHVIDRCTEEFGI